MIFVCTSRGSLQTGTTNDWFGTLLILYRTNLPKIKQKQAHSRSPQCNPLQYYNTHPPKYYGKWIMRRDNTTKNIIYLFSCCPHEVNSSCITAPLDLFPKWLLAVKCTEHFAALIRWYWRSVASHLRWHSDCWCRERQTWQLSRLIVWGVSD